MTRSSRSAPTYKESKKAFKQSAQEAGITCKPEIRQLWSKVVQANESAKARKPVLVSARNPRRNDGVRWNGGMFISPPRVEDAEYECEGEDECSVCDEGTTTTTVERERMVCLLDMARPVKARGIKKEFEVVAKVRGVIVLEDEMGSGCEYGDWDLNEEQGWEEILVDGGGGGGRGVKSFAEVVRAGE
ncbi:hypothetical protein AX17_006750 [Amanita inopinata Kibby_2008]|nr:hypothetical protein AX17_006750 [Amanita inopinata Kibby_2008]